VGGGPRRIWSDAGFGVSDARADSTRTQPLALLALALVPAFAGAGCGPTGGGQSRESSRPPSVETLSACLERSGATLRTDGRVPGPAGERRGAYAAEGTRYRGFAYWPSGHIADVWVANSEDAAATAETELETTFSKFAKGSSDEKIGKKGLMFYALDDFQTPTAGERRALERCL
jgi:hypothetical protein